MSFFNSSNICLIFLNWWLVCWWMQYSQTSRVHEKHRNEGSDMQNWQGAPYAGFILYVYLIITKFKIFGNYNLLLFASLQVLLLYLQLHSRAVYLIHLRLSSSQLKLLHCLLLAWLISLSVVCFIFLLHGERSKEMSHTSEEIKKDCMFDALLM